MSAAHNLPAPTITDATPRSAPSGRDLTSSTDQGRNDTQPVRVGAAPSTGTDQLIDDTQKVPVGSGPTSAPAATRALPTPNRHASRRDADLLLYLFADQLGDVESLRTATANRLRTLFSDEDWGKGVSEDLPEAKALTSQLEQIEAVEHGVTLSLMRAMRAHYLGPWCKTTVGVGEKQLGRLLAVIGDPAARAKPSQLWAYCGLHVLHPGQLRSDTQETHAGVDPSSDPGHRTSDTHGLRAGVAPTRTRGQQSNWSTEAKTRTYLIAESCMRAGVRKLPGCDDSDGYDVSRRTAITPYGQVYIDGRTKYADATHQHSCKRCGPSGKPAEVGTPLSLGHQQARAMRLVMKRILLDLWKQSREADA